MTFSSDRNWIDQIDDIKRAGLSGVNMASLAASYGVSRQRMKQVIDRHIPDWNEECGRVVKRREKATVYEAKWGNKQDTALYREQRLKFSRKKANATRIGWSWTVEFGELEWPTHCPLLGMELNYFAETRLENSPSFDRIDPSIGYDKGNVQVISWRASRIKSDGTPEEHRRIANYLETMQCLYGVSY